MNKTIFYNADYIVIEYIDIIKSPYLILLDQIRKNEKMEDIFNLDSIKYLDYPALYEWYLNRNHQNFLIDLIKFPDISHKDLDILLNKQMSMSSVFCKRATLLTIESMLRVCNAKKLVNEVLIYYPHTDKFAKSDLDDIMDSNYTFYNDFDEIIDRAGANSTYFISDINKIHRLKEKGVLSMSSITLPIEYRYNKKNMSDFSIDFNELFKECPFKLSYMRACTFEEKI